MQKPQGFQPILVKKPVSFAYKSDKAVPWRYATQGPDGRKMRPSYIKVTNISGMRSMTHNGQIFVAPESLVRSKDLKGKAKVGVEESNKAGLIPDEEIPAGRFAKEEEDFSKKGISTEEAIEFLQIIQ